MSAGSGRVPADCITQNHLKCVHQPKEGMWAWVALGKEGLIRHISCLPDSPARNSNCLDNADNQLSHEGEEESHEAEGTVRPTGEKRNITFLERDTNNFCKTDNDNSSSSTRCTSQQLLDSKRSPCVSGKAPWRADMETEGPASPRIAKGHICSFHG